MVFQPPNLPIPKSKEEALIGGLGQGAQNAVSMAQLWRQYKIQKRQQEIEEQKLRMEMDKLGAPTTILSPGGDVVREIPGKVEVLPQPRAELKAPTGFRYTNDGNLEAIPGGPADIKGQEKAAKEQGLQQAAVNQADAVINKVNQALSKVSGFTTGAGSFLSKIPGTSARNLAKDIDTIKANLGFATLQEMRRNSPTGGALGQVAVQELEMLQSTVSSLDPSQSKDQVIQNLNEVKQHFENWKNAVSQSGKGATDMQPAQGAVHNEALQWAMQNPNDPRAQRILQIHGKGQ